MDSRFDDLLHTIIVEKGQGIYGFFDVVFGFMYRRTDLMYEMAPGENMGFFPGQAEAIVYNYFRKYQNLHYKERVPKRNIDPKEVEEYLKKQKEIKEASKSNPQSEKLPLTESKNEINKVEIEENTHKENLTNTNNSDNSNSITQESKVSQSDRSKISESKPSQPSQSKVDTSISTYNGDNCENYNWSQGVMDVTLQIPLPQGTNKKMVIYFIILVECYNDQYTS